MQNMANKIYSSYEVKPITIGLSGGADSTLALILATYLRKLDNGYKLRAVHCIHGLDADDPIWLAHCQKLCERLQVELITPKLNIVYGNGISPEDSSRKERYRALLENKLDGYLMLGHQQDDQVENFLLALKRGAGPYGLSGMRELILDERGLILRPLLNLSKKYIEAIIQALGFDFVFDISNEYLKFERNFIRLKVLPLMRERFVGIDKSILRTQQLCSIEHDLAKRYISLMAKDYINNLCLDFSKLDLNDNSLCFMLLKYYLQDHLKLNADYHLIASLYELMQGSNDKKAIYKIGNYDVRRYGSKLIASNALINTQIQEKVNLKPNQSIIIGSFCYSLVTCDDVKQSFFLADGDSVDLIFKYNRAQKLKLKTRSMRRDIKNIFREHSIEPMLRDYMPLVYSHNSNRILALANIAAIEEDDLDLNNTKHLLYCLTIKQINN